MLKTKKYVPFAKDLTQPSVFTCGEAVMSMDYKFQSEGELEEEHFVNTTGFVEFRQLEARQTW